MTLVVVTGGLSLLGFLFALRVAFGTGWRTGIWLAIVSVVLLVVLVALRWAGLGLLDAE